MNEMWVVTGKTGFSVIDEFQVSLDECAKIASHLGLRVMELAIKSRSSGERRPGENDNAISSPERRWITGESAANSISCAITEHDSSLVVLPSSVWWDDVACRLAAHNGLQAVIGSVGWRVEGPHRIGFLRPSFENRVMQESFVTDHPCVVSLRQAGSAGSNDETRSVAIERVLEVEVNEPGGLRFLDVHRIDPLLLDVEDADVVIAGGRGIGQADGIGLLEDLARLLGGTVGGSRIAVDKRWVSKDKQIGQTGKTVRPKVYVAIGISGSSHHVLGMKDSEAVVVINTDPQAPIMQVADCVIGGDYKAYLPAVVKEIERRRSGGMKG